MIQLKITNLASNRIRAMARNIKNARPMFELINAQVVINVQQQIVRSENRPRWAPLKPRYAELKRATVGALPILIYSGELYRMYARAGAIRATIYTFGTSDPKMLAHHLGDPTRNIPPRPLNYAFAELLVRTEAIKFIKKVGLTAQLKLVSK